MNHTTLKVTLVCLCLIIGPTTPAWSTESTTTPPSGQFAPPPGYRPVPPWRGYAPAGVPRPGRNTMRRDYPAPGLTPPYGTRQRAYTPPTQPRQISPPAVTAATARERLQAELELSHAELDAIREELKQTRALLKDAGLALDRAYDEYRQVTAGNKTLEAELATALTERDSARERDTELSIELMAAEKQLAHAVDRLEQLEAQEASHTSERTEREQLLAERGARLAELEALLESRNAEASGLRSELDALELQLALMKTEVQAAADALIRAQTEMAAASTQRDEAESRQQACQAESERLANRLDAESGTLANAQRALAETEAARTALQSDLTACNSALTAAGADLETAQAEIEKMTTSSAPSAAASATPTPTPALQDSDADGVADSDDLCADTQPGASVGPTGCTGNAPVILEGVSFRYDSHELSARSRANLDRIAAILIQHPSLRLEVAGHTDTQGNPAYNQWLSQQRAASVMDYLVKQGVSPDNLTARGYGAQQPIDDNTTRKGLARNRRVELRRLP